MKSWQAILLGLFSGFIFAGLILLISFPEKGDPVTLLPSPTPSPIIVYVSGAVVSPGTYPLSRESRVIDAINAAGGFAQNANKDALNQALKLKDGDRVSVPTLIPTMAPTPTPNPNLLTTLPAPSFTIPAARKLVNINNASIEELSTLPGIGTAKAAQIIAYRQEKGYFQRIEDLMLVSGIGQAIFDKIKDMITVN